MESFETNTRTLSRKVLIVAALTGVIMVLLGLTDSGVYANSDDDQETEVKLLFKAMYTGTPLTGYHVNYGSEKSFKPKLMLDRKALYSGSLFNGSVFSVTNVSTQEVFVNEQTFKSQNVLGVGLSANSLKPNESLTLFLVEERGL